MNEFGELKAIMKECLEAKGYEVIESKLDELFQIYQDCQEWNEDCMTSGLSYDEIEDFVKHSPCVDEVFD